MPKEIDYSKLTPKEIKELKYGKDEAKEHTYNQEELDKLRQAAKNGKALSKDEAKALHEDDQKKDVKRINYILSGVNDVFKKKYDFKDDDAHFKVEIKAPSITDQAKIDGLVEQLTGGFGTTIPTFRYNAYLGLATLQVCGVDVPPELDASKAYATSSVMDWYSLIAIDYYDWLATFRS